ncbi:metal ABC transporter permease [Pilimelia columellifera]|uniref:Metal ABC transporter permease n=1 Tax=Pilimelia columellifera subsp. columellifera TaxID=706583 RepID=A0ABP6AYN8_9ACTN
MSLYLSDLMIRALIAAVIVGVSAPALGTYLVQRRMSMIGDGIGHVALTGVGLGLLLKTSPVLTAVVVATICAVGIELLRERGRTPGDLALAVLFYGGIAGGVVLVGLSDDRSNANLTSYLFGSLGTATDAELAAMAGVGALLVALMLLLRPALFAVCHDEEYARVSGLPVRALNLLLAATTAATITVAMRTVGLLLVSALMVIPVGAAQQLTRGFRATLLGAMGIGLGVSASGVAVSWQLYTAPGATIVVLAVALFVITAVAAGALRALRRRAAARAPASGEPSGEPADVRLSHG